MLSASRLYLLFWFDCVLFQVFRPAIVPKMYEAPFGALYNRPEEAIINVVQGYEFTRGGLQSRGQVRESCLFKGIVLWVYLKDSSS